MLKRPYFKLCFCFLLLYFISFSQNIYTWAGSNTPLILGDGGPATSAYIGQAYGIAIDGLGNTYIADQFHSRIRKVSTSGIIITIAGTGVAGFSGDGGPAISAQINQPLAIACDA